MGPHSYGSGSGSETAKIGWKWKQLGNEEEAAAAAVVHEKMESMSRPPPPPSGGYAARLLQVFNKIIQLLSLKRTTSQEEELELLFSGLHH
ncbi:hypothetical protein ABFS82_08G182500 [Erythranthe guttata]